MHETLTEAKKLVKLDYLEEVKVVTRFLYVNLWKDHHQPSYKKKCENYLAAYYVYLYETVGVEAWPPLNGLM